ncbi:Ig-like domain-containing protein, partial [Pseudooceanicola aestuarii]|uniref:Ig-like domain-containing protein n=1 Tax=Pseudooceanicola aestuarii TaxID=2697319 RepID=UPI0013D8C097
MRSFVDGPEFSDAPAIYLFRPETERGSSTQGDPDGTGAMQVAVPDAGRLFSATFERDGSDLILSNPGQTDIRIVEYFDAGPAPDLLAPNGAVLSGAAVSRLALPEAPGAYAQAGGALSGAASPIGQVEAVTGTARVQRSDGTVEDLALGGRIFANDVVMTEGDGTVSITFADGTIFSLAAGSRMIIDDLIYDPEGTENSGAFNLVQGGFVFIAGQVAKTGGMDVTTPTATMGIRGTTVSVDIQTSGGVSTVEIALNRDPDGGLGRIQIFDLSGNPLADITGTQTKWIISSVDGETREVDRSATDQAEDAILLADAVAAFQSAVARVQSGETFVDLSNSVRPGSGSQDPGLPGGDPFDTGTGAGSGGDTGPEDDDGIFGGDGAVAEDGSQGEDQLTGPEESEGNVPPVVQDGEVTGVEDGGEDAPITGSATATDADGDTLSYQVETPPTHGAVQMQPDGSFTYTPEADFHGQDSFTYIVTDPTGATDTGTITVTVAPTNDAPVLGADSVTATEDTALAGSIAGSDIDGDALSYQLASGAAHGQVVLLGDGSYVYTPDADFAGTDSFAVRVLDPEGASDTATVTVVVEGVNDAPVWQPGTAVVAEDGPALTIDLADYADDADAGEDGTSLSYTLVSAMVVGAVGGEAAAGGLPEGVITLDGRMLHVDPAGVFDALAAGETAQITVTLRATDAAEASGTGTLTLTVTGQNDAPVLADATFTTAEDTALTGTLIGADVDGDPLVHALAGQASHGIVTLDAAGRFTYDPDADFNGTDSFTVTLSDGRGGIDTATVTIQVAARNDPPAMNDGTLAVTEDGGPASLELSELASDVDAGDTLSYSFAPDSGDAEGLATLEGDRLTFDPGSAFDGLASGETAQITLTLRATDASGASADADVTVTITGANDAPVLDDLALTLAEDGSTSGTLMASDVDAGAALEYAVISQTAHGALNLGADGSYSYTPDADFHGTDSFVVQVSDGQGGSDTATITLNVTPVNDPPVLDDGADTLGEDAAPLVIDLVARDADAGDGATYQLITAPALGQATLEGNTLRFDPGADFQFLGAGETQQITIGLRVTDSAGATDDAVFTLMVTGTNDAPVVTGGQTAATLSEDATTPATGTLTASDAEGAVTWSGTAMGAYGSFAITADGNWSYTPDTRAQALGDATTQEVFSVTVADSAGVTASETVTITLNGTNDAAVITGQITGAVTEDTSLNATGNLNHTDVDGTNDLWQSASGQATHGSYQIGTDGNWSYVLGNSATVNALGQGETLSDSFTATTADGTTRAVTITITGTNDAAVITGQITGAVTEDTSLNATGNLNHTDVDGTNDLW